VCLGLERSGRGLEHLGRWPESAGCRWPAGLSNQCGLGPSGCSALALALPGRLRELRGRSEAPHREHPGRPAGAEAGARPVVGLCACAPMSPGWPCLAAHLQRACVVAGSVSRLLGDTRGWCGLVARGLAEVAGQLARGETAPLCCQGGGGVSVHLGI